MWDDLRLAARLSWKHRGFTIAAVAALAVGMSATITMFTLVNGVFLRDLPFADPDRIVSIGIRYVTGQPGRIDNLSFPDFKDLQASARLFDGIGAADEDTMDLADETHAAERFTGAYVSANAFGLIGHQPALGRGFTEEDEQGGAEPVVILGHALWQRSYSGDPGIVGRRVRVNGVLSTVVGVMPEGFGFPNQSALWQPLALRRDEERDRRDSRSIDAFGRMAQGVTVAQAETDLAVVMERLARDFPQTNAGIAPARALLPRCEHQRADPDRVRRADGVSGLPAAHRLRQRGQPAARARCHTRARDHPARLPRRDAPAGRASTPRREPSAGADRRCHRARVGRGRRASPPALDHRNR